MKILMLGWELPPHNSGGLGIACVNMARALARKGADIDFIVPYKAKHEDIDFMHVIPATSLDPIYRYGGAYNHVEPFSKVIPNASQNGYMSIRDIQQTYQEFVKNYLFGHKPDIIHAHDWLTYEAGILAKQEFNIPLIAHVHATEYDRAGMQTGNPLIHAIEQKGLESADEIIAVSESTRQIIHKKYNIPLKKIKVVYNSIDEDYENENYKLNQDLYRYLLDFKNKGYTIVTTVGRFTVQKGLQILMQSASLALLKNPKLMFIFAGDGEERDNLISLSAELGISKNVIFTGFLRGKQLHDIYALSDIFVMSSISEPFGLTALEAAHHGNALILTKQSGVSEIIWSALEYNYWDENRLADEILSISLNPTLKNTLSQNVMKEYHLISWNKVAERCLKIYNKHIKHKKD